MYWNIRFQLGASQAPGSTVLVSADDGAGKWSDEQLAQLLGVLSAQLPQKIYLDRSGGLSETSPLAAKVRDLGPKVGVVVRPTSVNRIDPRFFHVPSRRAIGDADVVVSAWFTNFLGFVVGGPSEITIDGKRYPALSVDLAQTAAPSSGYFIPDFAVDPSSIPRIDAAQLLSGKVTPGLLTGRNVILVAANGDSEALIGDFGHGRVKPVMLDIAGAKSLASGATITVGPLPMLLFFVAGVWLASFLRRGRLRRAAYTFVALGVGGGPVVLQLFGIYAIPSTGLVAGASFAAIRSWSKWRRKVQQTSSSGLPNFAALAGETASGDNDIVVASIGRYEEFLATLPAELHAECAQQIARRFSVGSNACQIYHGDNGQFAWIAMPMADDQQIEHYEGLKALFSAPLLVGGHMFDTNVHFGIDRNHHLDTVTRLNSAIASASEALKAGRTIEQFGAKRLADAPWELSLLARIDEGMKNGDIWLAYQPQWDYRDMRISGAEALIRWNDPERGPIRPDAFILQAERAGRIDALTYWVMEQAISAAEQFYPHGPHFQMSINLSAQLVDKRSLLSSVSEIVRRRGIDCRLFTIEVTETASVYNRPAAVENLQQLRAMGFRLSIDDYGTGESSLLYLAELPSDELKIDQHFVARILTGERERQIVHSTIRLAHALKQSVVAEGIEDKATFDLLRRMGCDTGQGYYIGRPETLDQLLDRYRNMGGARASSL